MEHVGNEELEEVLTEVEENAPENHAADTSDHQKSFFGGEIFKVMELFSSSN